MVYILLSKPWLHDNNVLYDNQSNSYRINHGKKNIKQLPFKPKSKPIKSKHVAPKLPKHDETSLVSLIPLPQLKQSKCDLAILEDCKHIVKEHPAPATEH